MEAIEYSLKAKAPINDRFSFLEPQGMEEIQKMQESIILDISKQYNEKLMEIFIATLGVCIPFICKDNLREYLRFVSVDNSIDEQIYYYMGKEARMPLFSVKFVTKFDFKNTKASVNYVFTPLIKFPL